MSFKQFILFFSLIGALLPRIGNADGLERFDSPASWQQDAELTDVFFLNEKLGWAVGAQGVILRTVDGGKHWATISTVPRTDVEGTDLKQKLRNMQSLADVDQLKPVRCRFETVHFVDANTGWIAGGYEYPYIDRSRAIVMKTDDGGLTWRQIKGLVLPRIRKLQFKNQFDGWAVGDKSNLYQTGIYVTSDGGNTWSSQSSGRLQNWLTGDATSDGFVLLDEQNRMLKVTEAQSEFSIVMGEPTGRIRDLSMLDDQRGLAVGDSGAILKTDNGGLSWGQSPQFNLPLLNQFDFQSLTHTADKFWVVGHPGSRVISIDKRSGQVAYHPTPAMAPLRKIVFANQQNGWAVGALGTIIATNDGGQTWYRQRGQNRVALLNIVTSESEVPLELLAVYANEEDMLAANVVLTESQKNVADVSLLRQATERLGACCSFGIPITSEPDPKNVEILVRTIRALQPNVIVTNSNHHSEALISMAIRLAGDRESFGQHSTDLGLEPWQVDRFAVESSQGRLKFDRRRLLTRSGQLIEDQVAICRALLGLEIQAEQNRGYRVANISSASQSAGHELFEGLNRFGTEIPTRKTKNRRGNLAVISRLSQKQKMMDQLAQSRIETPQQALLWRKQVQYWIGFVQPETAGVWVMQLAQRYVAEGQPEFAATAMELLTTRWPDHAFSPFAMKWLVHYYGSSEFTKIAFHHSARLRELAKADKSSQSTGTTAVMRDGDVVQSIWIPISQEELIAADSEATAESDDEQPADEYEQFAAARRQQASLYLARMRQWDPDLMMGPEYRLIESQLIRKQNGWLPVANLMKQLSKRVADYPSYALAARREIQIQDEDQKPDHILTAARTGERPYLDGKQDDQVWEDLRSAGKLISRSATLARTPGSDRFGFAYDDEFLYAIVTNQKIKGQGYDGVESKSTVRDPDLTSHDRIEIKIDTDRDYCTSMRFTVDHRGWASESCAGSVDWNPDWFVARSQDAVSWTIEIAIPLEQITGVGLATGDIWAIEVNRFGYDSRDLWQSGKTDESARADASESGLRAGLTAHPGQFHLLEFE